LNSLDKEEGLAEVRGFLAGSMRGRQMLVRFFCLGPIDSVFSISGVQLTDSAYVGHSEDLLYRPGYGQFERLGDSEDFFRVLHSAGRLENHVSADVDKRRIYVNLEDDIVYSVNTQYAGNTVGFKKLSLRLAICKADREGWLAEHMLVMGVRGPGGRVTYFTGAFPSGCGKTSTAMLPGETIVGDDIAYFRAIDGEARAVNVECGIFGIIRDVNTEDDPIIYDVLNRPGEVIFSNVLLADGRPYWEGMGCEPPGEGVNYSGPWHAGKQDAGGNEVAVSHWNARYTVTLKDLSNLDKHWDDPAGVPFRGIFYGGRDSDTCVPVQQSFDWAHGVVTMGAGLESETTAATIGQEGVRKWQPMSNLDFVSLPLGRYIGNNLEFGQGLAQPPAIFAVNYFLRGAGREYLNAMNDKHAWVKWAELRVHAEVGAIRTPTGLIPLYEDLVRLFRDVLGKDYARLDYVEQFQTRGPENLAKLDRIEDIFRTRVADTPPVVFEVLSGQRRRLEEALETCGDYVSPLHFVQTGQVE
ncbi:MAG: phosphoenolpyruvate carboxykinase (GTP), partial [Candidatus Brocadiia bacterium]|nr:phosphoenolpyruvate carboxykinase (GTP) [Candidatus Brocadiia bacterium]